MGCGPHRLAALLGRLYPLTMLLIQIILILFLLLALVTTWRRQRQHVIRWPEAIAWSLVWVLGAIAVLLPNVTTAIAHLFGVGRGVDFVLYGSVAALFVLVFKLFIEHEKLERKLTELVRRDALRDLKKD